VWRTSTSDGGGPLFAAFAGSTSGCRNDRPMYGREARQIHFWLTMMF